jgi:hypothetical protein
MGLGKTVRAITLLAGIKEGIACYPSGKNPARISLSASQPPFQLGGEINSSVPD